MQGPSGLGLLDQGAKPTVIMGNLNSRVQAQFVASIISSDRLLCTTVEFGWSILIGNGGCR
jgi:hypothetical protein